MEVSLDAAVSDRGRGKIGQHLADVIYVNTSLRRNFLVPTPSTLLNINIKYCVEIIVNFSNSTSRRNK